LRLSLNAFIGREFRLISNGGSRRAEEQFDRTDDGDGDSLNA
jgi:hypothetical protein